MIFRTIKDKNYMIVSNDTYMKDKELGFGAIGLMTILLSCKDATNFSLNFISVITCKRPKVVTKYLNELKNIIISMLIKRILKMVLSILTSYMNLRLLTFIIFIIDQMTKNQTGKAYLWI